jgi:hypothetical protein
VWDETLFVISSLVRGSILASIVAYREGTAHMQEFTYPKMVRGGHERSWLVVVMFYED